MGTEGTPRLPWPCGEGKVNSPPPCFFPTHARRPSTASGGYLTAEDADSSSRPSSATTTVAVTADNVSRTSSLEAPRLSVLSQPSLVWPPPLADEQPPRSSSPPPASRPQSSAGARVRGAGGSSLVGDWRTASAAPSATPPAGSSLRASVANIARPEDFPPVPERGHRERHSRPTAVVESDEDDDPPLRRQSVDVFIDAVDDEDEDGDDVPGMPLPPPPPMPWRNLGPRPLSRDPEMEARKAAQEVKALTQEDEALIMRMSLPMRPLSLRPATAAGGFAGSASSNGYVRSPPAPRLPPVSAAPASSQQRGYVSAMEWGWATDEVAAAPAHHGGAAQLPPRVSRSGAGNARSSSGTGAPVEVAARTSMSRGGDRRLTTPPRAAAVPQPAPVISAPPPRVRVPPPGPPVRPTTAAARTPVHQHESAAGSTPPSSGRLDTFLARQMAFMQLYKERRQAREATQTTPTRPGTSRR